MHDRGDHVGRASRSAAMTLALVRGACDARRMRALALVLVTALAPMAARADEARDEAARAQAFGYRLLEDGDYYRAITELKRVLAEQPKNGLGNQFYGLSLYRQGDTPNAIKAFQMAVANDPGLVDAWVALGKILQDQKKNPEAIAAFKGALAVEPKNPDALRGLKDLGVDPTPAPDPKAKPK